MGQVEEPDDDDPWEDWVPETQKAYDVLEAHRRAQREAEDEEEEEEDDDDEWCPGQQEADEHAEEAAGDGEDEESDDDWAPQAQGAADKDQSEQEALKSLLKTEQAQAEGPRRYESKKEADAAGKMLYELKRPPTVEEAKAQIPKGPDVDAEQLGQPAYRNMTQDEAIDMVTRGATVNLHGQHGRTPLHKACEYAYPLLVKALCDAGADPDIRDNYGETPLLLMAHTGPWNEDIPKARRSETIQMLLSCGADVHVVNPRGRGALHFAATENDHQAIETLIEGMADVNATDLAGFTPLMWAAGRNGSQTVKMLLDYDADINIKAGRGQTAMTFALTNGCNAIVDILEKHQAILDQEEAKRIKDQGEREEEEQQVDKTLQLPRPEWACKKEAPEEVEPYQGRRVYIQAKPDRRSNVYT